MNIKYKNYSFLDRGSDERQFCSLELIYQFVLLRTKHGKFREYHTSLDDLDFISKKDFLNLSNYEKIGFRI